MFYQQQHQSIINVAKGTFQNSPKDITWVDCTVTVNRRNFLLSSILSYRWCYFGFSVMKYMKISNLSSLCPWMAIAVMPCFFAARIIRCDEIQFDGLVQERHNSIANALVLRLSSTNPYILSSLYSTIFTPKTAHYQWKAKPTLPEIHITHLTENDDTTISDKQWRNNHTNNRRNSWAEYE